MSSHGPRRADDLGKVCAHLFLGKTSADALLLLGGLKPKMAIAVALCAMQQLDQEYQKKFTDYVVTNMTVNQ